MLVKKRALIFIDHDLIVRHFIKSGAFRELEQQYDVTYVFNIDGSTEKKWLFTDVASLGLRSVVQIGITRARMGSWYKLYAASVLRNQRGTKNYRTRKRLMAEISGSLRTEFYTLLSLPYVFPLFRRFFIARQGIFQPLADLIRDLRPDIVFHPSVLAGYFVNELPPICNTMNIPLVMLMNSWDNPSAKALVTSFPDKLVVWGEQTRQHAIEYMRMPEQHVLSFGAAQFQIYREPVKESYTELRAMFKVPEGLPIVLYGGASKGAHESRYLKLLDDLIETGAIPRCHVIYRPHPWRGELAEGETGFFDLGCRHISIDPFMESYYRRATTTGQFGIEMADYTITRKLLHLVSAVISPLSTILLESSILGKPVLMFFPKRDLNQEEGRFTKFALEMPHFADFWGEPGVNVCDCESEFSEKCRLLLAQTRDPSIREGLLRHVRRFLVMDGATYGERIRDLADQLTNPVRHSDR
jgi:hypothetical protein